MKKYTLLLWLASLFLNAVAQHGPKLRRIEGQGNDGLVLDFVAGMHDSILNSPNGVYKYPLYDNDKGPVHVDIYNSALTPPGEFQIIFNDTSLDFAGNDLTDPSTKWMLVNVALHDTVFGDSIIGVNYTQDITAWGLKIRTNPTDNPGTDTYTNNGFLEASMTFADPALPWLSGLPDEDWMTPQNWIRSGTNAPGAVYGDYPFLDDHEYYEHILHGTWAPYRLVASQELSFTGIVNYGAPAWDKYRTVTLMKNLASVDIVITADKTKWTRCPVLELQDEEILATGGAKKMGLRKSLSIDKNGKKAGDAGYNAADGDVGGTQLTGMGWFPGYAINLETGERLNMAFGEDSYYPSDNGKDMIWNPTSTIYSGTSPNLIPVFGGKHYIYVFGHNGDAVYPATDAYLPNELKDIPAYDKGVALYKLLHAAERAVASTSYSESYMREVYTDAMWVNIPLLNPGYSLLATDVNIRLRVSKQYRQQNIDNTNHTNPKYIFDAGTLAGIGVIPPEQNDLLLYPNPANNIIYISYKSQSKNTLIQIYDVTGQLIKSITTAMQEQVFDISGFSNGLYVVKLSDGKNVTVKRFIKQ